MQNMDLKRKSNDWDVNLVYISEEDLKNIYGFIPDKDQKPSETNATDYVLMAISFSSERINTLTGNKIESIGFNNLNETQKKLVKRATCRMVIYYLGNGMEFIRSSVSISGNGLASSVNPPAEPDYVINDCYDLLQQASLHNPRVGVSFNYCQTCNREKSNCLCGFNKPSIYDESDCRTVSWDSANKTFLQPESVLEGANVTIQQIPGTVPKIKINANINSNIYETKEEHNADITNLKTQIDTKSDAKEVGELFGKLNERINDVDERSLQNESNVRDISLKVTNNEINIKNLTETVDKKADKTDSGGWIEGEYKYMPKSVTKMPNGWVKVRGGNIVNDGYVNIMSVNLESNPQNTYFIGKSNFTDSIVTNIASVELWQYDPNNKFLIGTMKINQIF